jgi:hypothetical protein
MTTTRQSYVKQCDRNSARREVRDKGPMVCPKARGLSKQSSCGCEIARFLSEMTALRPRIALIAIFDLPALVVRFGNHDARPLRTRPSGLVRESIFGHAFTDYPEEPVGIRQNHFRKGLTGTFSKIQRTPTHLKITSLMIED